MYRLLNLYDTWISSLSIYAFITFALGLFQLSAIKFIGKLGYIESNWKN